MRLRLYCDASKGDKPRSMCQPVKLHSALAVAHAEARLISFDAIDQIYEIRNHPVLLDVIGPRDDVEVMTEEIRKNCDPRLYFAAEVTG